MARVSAMVEITVRAVPGGWVVDASQDAATLFFSGGAKAEAKARELAGLIAERGVPADLRIHDRSGGLIGAFRYAPRHAA
jgi:hypothetical protein